MYGSRDIEVRRGGGQRRLELAVRTFLHLPLVLVTQSGIWPAAPVWSGIVFCQALNPGSMECAATTG